MASDAASLGRAFRSTPVLAVLVWVVFGASAAAAGAAAGEPVDGGDVVLVDASARPLASGNSDVRFTLRLPDEAVCPGDSANDQWRWQTFIVPSETEIGDITWGVIGPEGDGQAALYDTSSRYLSHQNLLPNQATGEPGRLPTLPFMSFSGFPKGYLADGAYRIGLACTLQREPSIYWDASFVVSTSAEGGSAGFAWASPTAPAGAVPAESAESRNWRSIVAAAIAAAAIAGAFLLWRSASTTSSRKEQRP